jgi:excisionase family DNA binding protein
MLTAPEAAKLLGIAPGDVYRLVRQKVITFYRIGSALRFDPADVQKYKAEHLRDPKPMQPPKVLREVARLYRLAGEPPPLTDDQLAMAAARHRHMRLAPWADASAVRAFYAEARRLTETTGVPHHVDHIIPLQGDYVSGLHVETNLQVLPATDNIRKLNKVPPC